MYRTMITPRVSETDGLGHINNTVMPVWFEAGRREIFELFSPVGDFAAWRMIVASLTIDFLHEVFYGVDVEVRVCISHIGRSSLRLSEELWQAEKLCAKGEATYVNVDPRTKKSTEIPGDIREQLNRHSCLVQ